MEIQCAGTDSDIHTQGGSEAGLQIHTGWVWSSAYQQFAQTCLSASSYSYAAFEVSSSAYAMVTLAR